VKLAFELYRMSQGLEHQPSVTAGGAPIVSSDSVDLKLAVELCRLIESSPIEETPSAPSAPRRPESETIASIFEENLDGYEPDAEGLAANTQPAALSSAARPQYDPIDPSGDLANGLANELNRLSEGMETPAVPAATVVTRAPQMEPIDVPANPESGIAYELNRGSEGLGMVPPGLEKPGDRGPRLSWGLELLSLNAWEPGACPRAPGPPDLVGVTTCAGRSENIRATFDGGLGRAISLTRDATLAWMNVLMGPTVVKMTAR
jgi:hypothetical protein